MERKNPGINDVRLLGVAFIRWGLGLFIFGLIIGCSPLVHYLQGVLERMGETTLQNAALWLASPYTVQIGALGMVAIGAVYGLLPTSFKPSRGITRRCGCALPAWRQSS